MKIKIASVEDGIDNVGFRKISSYVQLICPDTEVYYVTTGNVRAISKRFFPSSFDGLDDDDIKAIAEALADADIVGLSAMTPYSSTVKRIIAEIRKVNDQAFVIWGGIHAIVHPEDAILHADAICTGEGEFALRGFSNHSSQALFTPHHDCRTEKSNRQAPTHLYYRVSRRQLYGTARKNSAGDLRSIQEGDRTFLRRAGVDSQLRQRREDEDSDCGGNESGAHGNTIGK